MGDTMRRIGLWVLGMMLPREEVFQYYMRHMARGVTLLVCGGVIVTTLFMALLGVMYLALVDQGLSGVAAGTITTAFALAGAAICFLLAERSLSRASNLTNRLHLKAPSLPKVEASLDLQEGTLTLVNAFLDGVTGRSGMSDSIALKRRHQELLERIAEMEAELEAEVEAVMDVVQEYDADKDIIHFRPKPRHSV